jgi:hypothetical protein
MRFPRIKTWMAIALIASYAFTVAVVLLDIFIWRS